MVCTRRKSVRCFASDGMVHYLCVCQGPTGAALPLVPDVQHADGTIVPGDPTTWLPLTPGHARRPYSLPVRTWVYPSPGYLRMVTRAHAKAGIVDNFLDSTLLMDRHTTVRTYLDANPLLHDWVHDPKVYKDRVSDRYMEE